MQENSKAYWFVGANYDGDDQTQRFLTQEIWENGYDDKYLDLVRSMKPGDQIAIKSAYTRKNGLTFNVGNNYVAVMKIKAIGTIIKNLNDGKVVTVEWKKIEPEKEWYFFTQRNTIWNVSPSNWMGKALIDFTFHNQKQDIEKFLQSPYWSERYGLLKPKNKEFKWVEFYEAVAEKLLTYTNNRKPLVDAVNEIASRRGLNYLQDKFESGLKGSLTDICPFTTMGMFNRSMTIPNRRAIAGDLASFLGVDIPVPDNFDGVPVLNNQRSWFFRHASDRGEHDIDNLWKVFVAANQMVRGDQSTTRDLFLQAFDNAIKQWGVAWNLSTGLYWAHPWEFPTLDKRSRLYIKIRLGLKIVPALPLRSCNAESYIKLTDELESWFVRDDTPVHSFPALSFKALETLKEEPLDDSDDAYPQPDNPLNKDESTINATKSTPLATMVPYGVDDILKEGCFLEQDEVSYFIERLKEKKNLILQGPPGTGKTWLARKLGSALIGFNDPNKIRVVQFHPNLSYEDFVRGWRPSPEGLTLIDGVFLESVNKAMNDPDSVYVLVIEEINRGNTAQIFGELLTLLEESKRKPEEAIELCYPDSSGKRTPVYIPSNLYIIGTMNVADRSLSMVDLALRRRFAFIDLKPEIGLKWQQWLIGKCGMDADFVSEVQERMMRLNNKIEQDVRLGRQFKIGHSYVTPSDRREISNSKTWFKQIIKTELAPLLDEYWFDAPAEVKDALTILMQDL